jgi:hypothetical protein
MPSSCRQGERLSLRQAMIDKDHFAFLPDA